MSDELSPWDMDAAVLGNVVGESLRDLVSCWVHMRPPTTEQANAVSKAHIALGYLVTRANQIPASGSVLRGKQE